MVLRHDSTDDSSDCDDKQTKLHRLIPIFRNLRIVKVCRARDGRLYLVCSCCYFRTHGLPCRHIIVLLGGKVRPEHCSVFWYKAYSAYFDRKGFDEVTSLLKRMRDTKLPGPQLTDQDISFLCKINVTSQSDSRMTHIQDVFGNKPNQAPVVQPGTGFYGSSEATSAAHSKVTADSTMAGGFIVQQQKLTWHGRTAATKVPTYQERVACTPGPILV